MLALSYPLTAAPENSGLLGDEGSTGLAVLSGPLDSGAGADEDADAGATTLGGNVLAGATGAAVPLLKGPTAVVKLSGVPVLTTTGATVIGSADVWLTVTTWAILPQVFTAKSSYTVTC